MMEYEEFRDKSYTLFPVGKILQNPKKGTTIIKSHPKNKIGYIRGKSTIYVDLQHLFSAYTEFKGKQLNATDLRIYLPTVFDSKKGGHTCNCTFLFLLFKELGITSTILGAGTRNSPFGVELLA